MRLARFLQYLINCLAFLVYLSRFSRNWKSTCHAHKTPIYAEHDLFSTLWTHRNSPLRQECMGISMSLKIGRILLRMNTCVHMYMYGYVWKYGLSDTYECTCFKSFWTFEANTSTLSSNRRLWDWGLLADESNIPKIPHIRENFLLWCRPYRPIGRALIRHLSDFFACHQSHGLRC